MDILDFAQSFSDDPKPFSTVYEGTKLINLITPRRPIISNNFLIKFREYLEEAGVKRVPKKKPRKVYRLKVEKSD